jgi:sugar lactone lactonase YvrE
LSRLSSIRNSETNDMSQPGFPSPSRALTAIALAAFLAGGCASAPAKKIVFPPPPDKGRIEHVRSFNQEMDIRKGFWGRLLLTLFPREGAVGLIGAYGIALSPDEKTLYVAVPATRKVVAIDRESGRFTRFGHEEDNLLSRPIGIGTDADGNVYVADRDGSAIFVYDAGLKLRRKFGGGQLKTPTLLTVDRKNRFVYVVNDADSKNGRNSVEVFSLAGEHLRTIGGGVGTAEGYFFFPKGVAVAPNGDLYVSDLMNFRIQVFDSEGRFLRSLGEQGAGVVGKFDKVQGVSWDNLGDLYVADSAQGVQILNDRFQPLLMFNGGFFQVPLQVVIDSSNHIFVSDVASGLHEFLLVNTTKEETYARPLAAPQAAKPAAADPAPQAPPATPAP